MLILKFLPNFFPGSFVSTHPRRLKQVLQRSQSAGQYGAPVVALGHSRIPSDARIAAEVHSQSELVVLLLPQVRARSHNQKSEYEEQFEMSKSLYSS
jgi:hypothetical protein